MNVTGLSNAVGFIFHGPLSESNPRIHVFDYRDETVFRSLWLEGLASENLNINGFSLSWKDCDRQILIIGCDPPDAIFNNPKPSLQGINFRDHLNANSWLAAWKVRFPDANARIAVIDPRDAKLARGAAAALQTVLSARDVLAQTFVPRASVLNAPNLDAICRCLRDSTTDTRTTPPHVSDLLRSTIWSELTSTREQHHALSNVLGAFLLSSQVGKERTHPGDPWIQDYFLALLRACGVGADTRQVKVGEHQGFQCWMSHSLQKGIGAAVLIDDMADLWEYFVRGALGFVGNGMFSGTDRTFSESFASLPREQFFKEIVLLPGRLSLFLESERHFLTADVFISGEQKITDRFVLFLDLRLFPDQATSSGSEARNGFFRNLAAFGLKLLDSPRSLPWINEEGKTRLREELVCYLVDSTGHMPATRTAQTLPPEETLLPRLLSLLDPTLPIVIFSSTHRSELIDPFRDYGNIITTFRKPILSGLTTDWVEIVKELHLDFGSALEQAARILRVRDTIWTFCQLTLRKETVELPESRDGYLIEIFLDESEEPTQQKPPRAVCSGGIVVIRVLGQNGDPVITDASIFESLAQSHALWGWCAETPNGFVRPQNSPQQRGFMPKGAGLNFSGNGLAVLEAMVNGVRSALGGAGCVIPFALIRNRGQHFPDWMEAPSEITPWSVEKLLDATLRGLVQHALESLLFRSKVLKFALDNPKSRVAIDLGIRDYPCESYWPLFENFGFEVRANGWRPSFHNEDGFQITAETIARIGIRWPFPAGIVRARAVALRDFGKFQICPGGLLPKQLHYFADTISHVALYELVTATSPASQMVRDFFASGWITDFRSDKDEETRMLISRAWTQGDRVEAIRWAAGLKGHPPDNGLGIDLFRDLSHGSNRLAGAELTQLFAGL